MGWTYNGWSISAPIKFPIGFLRNNKLLIFGTSVTNYQTIDILKFLLLAMKTMGKLSAELYGLPISMSVPFPYNSQSPLDPPWIWATVLLPPLRTNINIMLNQNANSVNIVAAGTKMVPVPVRQSCCNLKLS